MDLGIIQTRDLSGGVLQKLDNNLAPKNSVPFSYNFLYNEVLGRGVVRGGTALVGAQITDTKTILGIFQFILSSGTKHLLSVVDGTPSQIYRLESGTWTTTGSDGQMTAGAKVRFLTFLDTVLALDGTLKKTSADGTAWVTSAGNLDVSNMPAAKYAVERKDRVFLAGVSASKDRVFFSSIQLNSQIVWHRQNCVFSSTDTDTVSWAAGQLTLPDGTVYQIAAGNTGNMAAKTYIYLDINVSTTAYQITTTASTALGTGKFLVASALNNATLATYELQGNGGFLDVEPLEGQGVITGLAKVPGYLLIFKERALKRWNGNSTFPDDLCSLGTPSNESIVFGKTTAFYFSASGKRSIGFYETNGETTRKISRPIQKVVEAISASNYANVAGFSDGEIVMWSIGDITYDGISYPNVVVLYDIESTTWAVLGFPTEFKNFSNYIDTNTLKIVGGNDDGEVIELFTGTKDNYTGNLTKEIQYAVHYNAMDLGDRSKVKSVSKVVPHVENGLGMNVSVRVDKKQGYDEKGATTDDFENEVNIDEKGHLFEFRLAGLGLGGLTELIGFDILSPDITKSIQR